MRKKNVEKREGYRKKEKRREKEEGIERGGCERETVWRRSEE